MQQILSVNPTDSGQQLLHEELNRSFRVLLILTNVREQVRPMDTGKRERPFSLPFPIETRIRSYYSMTIVSVPGCGAFWYKHSPFTTLEWVMAEMILYSACVLLSDCKFLAICLEATNCPVPVSLASFTTAHRPRPNSDNTEYR